MTSKQKNRKTYNETNKYMKYLPLILFAFLLFNISASAQNEIEIYKKNARDLSKQEKYPEAIAEINKAIALEPSNSFLYLKDFMQKRIALAKQKMQENDKK